MDTNPILLFRTWYEEFLKKTTVKLPSTCCLSTIGLDQYPNSRFVALKEVSEEGFIVTGTVTSRKGAEISTSNKVALAFWWAETEKQVRIQGDAEPISAGLADKFFSERSRDSQIVSSVSNQGKELTDPGKLIAEYEIADKKHGIISRPENWGGYLVKPKRIEFLEFKSTRFHDRTLYELNDTTWGVKKLQP